MHTPGPWKVYEGMDAESILQSGWVLVVCSNDAGRIVANVNLNGGPESKPMPCMDNARLIASAPDLLSVLEKVESTLSRGNSFYQHEIQEIRIAIAKAKGTY